MPEGPEIHMAARFINRVSALHSFTGKVVKSEVSTKNPDVDFEALSYTISAEARGKELKVYLEDNKKKSNCVRVLFRFGMSGCFQLTPASDLPKHAHLRFFTPAKVGLALSFVDYRRFGRWEVEGEWGVDRGPDPINEYAAFRDNILANLEKPEFKKPICQVMLNQKYFNGVGNYLRAEVLFRLAVPPFSPAYEVLMPLVEQTVKKEEGLDLLQLCNQLMREVLDLPDYLNDDLSQEGSSRKGDDEDTYAPFSAWLRCYSQEGMKNLRDGNGRTIWFQGPAGSLAPKGDKVKQVAMKKKYKVAKSGSDKHDVKEEVKEEKDVKNELEKKPKIKKELGEKTKVKNELEKKPKVKKELEEKPKVKKELEKKPKSKTTKLKEEKPVIKEEPLVREESVLSNKTVMKERRKADKSETKTGENGLEKTAQLEVPVKRVRRK